MTRASHGLLPSVVVAALCAALLACGAKTGDVDRNLAALTDPHWQVRAAAAEQLARLRADDAIPGLRNALGDESAEVRTAALTALGRLGARAAIEDIRSRIEGDESDQAVVQALFALASVSSPGDPDRQHDIDLVVDKLYDERVGVASAARRVLMALFGRPGLVAMVRTDLRSRASASRIRASRMAGVLELPELEGWEALILGDQDGDVRGNAYDSMLRHPQPDDYEAFVRGLSDPNPVVRLESTVGLEVLHDPAAVPALTRTAGDDADPDVRSAAAETAASIAGVHGSQLPALWHFERVDDRVVVGDDGACSLTRRFTVVVDRSPEAIASLKVLVPHDFPRVDRLTDEQGHPLAYALGWTSGLRELTVAVPPLASGDAATLTLYARSERPVTVKSATEVLVAYRPAPLQARVVALHVGIASRAGELAVLDRSHLSPGDLEQIEVRAVAPSLAAKRAKVAERSYSRGFDLSLAFGVVAAILACLAATIVRLRRTMGARSDRAVLAAVLAAGAILLLTPILVEDNYSYFALARSAVLDGDLDRGNEYAEFNQTKAFAPDNRDAQDPMFASLARTPFLIAAHGLVLGGSALSPSYAPNGLSFPYLFLTALGDFFAVLIGCLACFSLVDRRVGSEYALFGVLVAVFGTNLLLFAYAWTGSSFQPSFALFALFLNHWDKTRDARRRLDWVVSGAFLGLLGMTRTLNLGFVLLPVLDWSLTAVARLKERGSRAMVKHGGDGALLALGMLLGFAPQLCVQRLLDQVWVVDAYGVGTGRFAGLRDNAWALFFSRPNGLFTSMPVLALAFIGLALFARRDRRLGLLLAATLALQLVAIGSYELWWGYFVYGTPYVVPCTPIFCLGLAALFRDVRLRWRRPGVFALAGLVAAGTVRNGWCLLRQLADKMIGEWQDQLGVVPIVHTMLMLDRKFDVDILRYSSEFGCLVREIVGALRALDPGRLLAASFWVSLVVLPLVVTYPATRMIRGWVSRVPAEWRVRVAVSVAVVAWMAVTGWLVTLAARTDLDYAYRIKARFERPREFAVERIEPGQSFTWQFVSSNPSERFSVITFLDAAPDAAQGEPVATVELIAGGQRSEFVLRAGVDTADFEVERPESAAQRAHTPPLDRAAMSWRVRDDSSRFYTARAYLSVFDSPVASKTTELKLTSSLKRGAVAVVVANSRERKVPPESGRRRWIADQR